MHIHVLAFTCVFVCTSKSPSLYFLCWEFSKTHSNRIYLHTSKCNTIRSLWSFLSFFLPLTLHRSFLEVFTIGAVVVVVIDLHSFWTTLPWDNKYLMHIPTPRTYTEWDHRCDVCDLVSVICTHFLFKDAVLYVETVRLSVVLVDVTLIFREYPCICDVGPILCQTMRIKFKISNRENSHPTRLLVCCVWFSFMYGPFCLFKNTHVFMMSARATANLAKYKK